MPPSIGFWQRRRSSAPPIAGCRAEAAPAATPSTWVICWRTCRCSTALIPVQPGEAGMTMMRNRAPRSIRTTPPRKGEGGTEESGYAPLARAHRIAAAVLDPEIPVLTLEDLGVLRGVETKQGRI